MDTSIAFLRAINLGARRRFPKGDIVAAVERAGGTRVETYINTGNVRLDLDTADRAEVEKRLEEAFLADRGFEVPTICLTPAELVAVAADAERFAAAYPGRVGLHYVSLLKDEPGAEAVALAESASTEAERCHVSGRGVHLLLGEDYHSARLSNAVVERTLGVATNRNLTVIRTLAQRWGEERSGV